MTFLWQHCVFVNTSYLSQYIILVTIHHTCHNTSYFSQHIILVTIHHTCHNTSYFSQYIILVIIHHTCHNTSYLLQYIILLTTSFKASQENISPSVCGSAGITPANTRIHHFAGVTTGKRQNVVFHINRDSLSGSVCTIFCSCYYSVGEANKYYHPYLDTSNNGPSDITKSQRLFSYYQMYMTQEQPEGLPECV